MYKKTIFAALMLLCLASASVAQTQVTAEKILEKVDSYRGYNQAFSMTVKVRDYNKEAKLKNQIHFKAYIKDRQSSFLNYQYPKLDKGKVMLMVADNVWFYHKKIAKPLRLSQRQRLLGNVSNADVARANFSFDYQPTLKGKQEKNGQELLTLELIAKHKKAAYSKIMLYVLPQSYKPVIGEFYAFSGRLLKESHYKEFQKVDNQEKLKRMDIYDAVLKGSRTTIEYSDFTLEKLPDHYFNADFLPRIKRI